ncbi:MAG: 50S ribosomal protein L20 [Patescibacteria group bacterium]|nr:MAG: 50S ribosomal protein L20 [Patescibacteria group bacterium]
MVRVKSLSSKKHKKILKLARGYRMTRRKLFKKAMEAVLHAGEYSFAGRKQKKRQFRSLWILRINNAVRALGGKYSKFIHNLKEKKIEIDRKILAKLAVENPEFFKQVFEKANKN